MTYVPYLRMPSPHIFPASTQTLLGRHSVPFTGSGLSTVGGEVMIGISEVEIEQGGIEKVGVAIIPDVHSTQVLWLDQPVL